MQMKKVSIAFVIKTATLIITTVAVILCLWTIARPDVFSKNLRDGIFLFGGIVIFIFLPMGKLLSQKA
jgi:hypothetical protein